MTFTDPPYTLAGAVLFLSRAAAAVRQRGSVFLSFGPGRPGVSVRVQWAIGGMGFAIQALTRDFNRCLGAGVLGGASNLYHLIAAGEPHPLVTETFARPLYTADAPSRGVSRPSGRFV